MPRFVLLRHECPPEQGTSSHWDLMLERDGALMTWRLAALPAAGEPLAATRLADHRLAYLDVEGPVSGGRGEVQRVDKGEYLLLDETPSELQVELYGEKLNWRGVLPRAVP